MRVVFRAPVRLYDHGLGWMFGTRFVCLTHFGRRSGRRYRTVLEVIGTHEDEVMVIAGLGPSSDWFRNVEAGCPTSIEIGTRSFTAEHRVLGEPEAVGVIAAYERRNRLIRPIVRRVLSVLLGRRYDGSDSARTEVARRLPVVAFRPVHPVG